MNPRSINKIFSKYFLRIKVWVFPVTNVKSSNFLDSASQQCYDCTVVQKKGFLITLIIYFFHKRLRINYRITKTKAHIFLKVDNRTLPKKNVFYNSR